MIMNKKSDIYTPKIPPSGGEGASSSLFLGIFGRRNTGKSSLINLLTGQDIAIVSEIPGTTTDPVRKSVEILGLGPVIVVDTAGIDDEGDLGQKRVQKSKNTIKNVDCAVLLISENRFDSYEKELIKEFENFDTPYLIVHNKSDLEMLEQASIDTIRQITQAEIVDFTTINDQGKDALIEKIKELIPKLQRQKKSLFGGLVKPKDVVLLITPIDSAAPEGRLILPQNQSIRNLLDNDCITIVVKDTGIADFLKLGITPALAVTDSSIFDYVSEILPKNIPLTSFSILFARLKGDFEQYLKGTRYILKLNDGDRVLILESCTHQTSCDDIGRVKIPKLLQKYTGKKLEFDVVSGLAPAPLNPSSPKSPQGGTYALVIQCGGCMVTRKQLLNRLKPFVEAGIPVTNYGMTLAYVNGIFERATEVFR